MNPRKFQILLALTGLLAALSSWAFLGFATQGTGLILLGGTWVFFLAFSLAVYTALDAASKHANRNRFVQVYLGSFLVKFFVVILVILGYKLMALEVSFPVVFALGIQYLLFTILLSYCQIRLARQTTHAKEPDLPRDRG